jgi:hypothetical protein
MYATPTLRWRLPAVLAGLFALSTSLSPLAHAKEAVDRDDRSTTQHATKGGACDPGTAEEFLDGNNVNALLFNVGALFWKGGDHIYEIPKGSGRQAIFASGIWIGGQVGGVTRFAGSDYGPYEYWPGPLDASGEVTPDVCSQFDRFWKVERSDITEYNETGSSDNDDLASWPIAWGAPFFNDLNGDGRRNTSDDDDDGNADGILNEPAIELQLGDPGYGTRTLDLGAGERQDIIGDQGIWWVMNDKGDTHDWGGTPAIGLEVQAQAFAFNTADALNNTTFYKYQIFYRGDSPLTNAYIGLWSDPDLGFFSDDYVGSNPDEGIGYVYNGDSFDEGSAGYGAVPPALGYDFFQGPLVDADGVDNDGDGDVDEAGERIAMEKFVYYNNDSSVQGNPGNGQEAYQYLQGQWRDGSTITFGGTGFNTGDPADFMFPGSPPSFWSEYNIDGLGTANTPADRRFVMSSGPFTINPGDFQEVVFGIVWSQANGTNAAQPQIASVRKMFFDDITAQAAFNANFDIPPPPPAVEITATPLDEAVVLEWDSETGDLGDLFGYEVVSPFADPTFADDTYNFEGFKVFQFRSDLDTEGQLIATFDLENNVTGVTDVALDTESGEIITEVVALGEDNGTATTTPTAVTVVNDVFTGEPLRNNTSYYFGVQPYAYNAGSSPQKVYAAPVRRVEVRPSQIAPRAGGTVLNAEIGSTIPVLAAPSNGGQGQVIARVVNPAAVTGDNYEVRFFTQLDEDGDPATDEDGNQQNPNYDIVNSTTGEVIFSGQSYFDRTGVVAPQTSDVVRVDGLAFDVSGPDPAFTNFLVTANANGPIVPATGGAADFGGYPVPERPGADQQVGPGIWFIHTGGDRGSFEEFVDRGTRGGGNWPFIAPFDFEMRFTARGSIAAKDGIFGQAGENPEVPFELWNIGAGTPDDTSDDFRMIPILLDIDDDNTYNLSSLDSPVSSAENDPYTDWIYFYNPVDTTPGEAGYNAFAAGGPTGLDYSQIGNEAIARTVIVGWNLGTAPPYPMPYPEEGTVFRIETSKPNAPGDVFTANTAEFAADRGEVETAQDALDLIAITPNPYRGVAEYETASSEYIARIVNLPESATIRIFTLSGTLVRTLEKTNPAMTTIDWDLRSEANLPIASGIYLIHVEARNADGTVLGERVLKFGVVQRRVQLDVL